VRRLGLTLGGAACLFLCLPAGGALAGTTAYSASLVPMGSAPFAIAYDPAMGLIYVGTNSGLSVIESSTNTVVASIALPTYAASVAVDTLTDTVYVGGLKSGHETLTVINGSTDIVTATIDLADTRDPEPAGLAVDQATDTVYVATNRSNALTVIDGATDMVTGTITVTGAVVLGQIAYDATTGSLYVTGDIPGTARDNGLWVVDAATQAVTASVNLGPVAVGAAPGVAVNASTDTIYVALPGAGEVKVIDGGSDTVTATLSDYSARGVAVDQATNTVYVTSNAGVAGSTTVIDGATNTVTGSIGRGGTAILIDGASSTEYVPCGSVLDDTWVITPSTSSTMSPVFVGGSPGDLTVGQPVSYSFQVSAAPAATVTETGALPAGVTLSSSGMLAGTPAVGSGGFYPITITAANGIAPAASKDLDLVVQEAPAITSPDHVTFMTETYETFVVQATGDPAPTFSETGRLPAGVELTTTGALIGTPSANAGGSYPITISASNGISPNASQSFTLTVDQPPAITSAARTTFTIGRYGKFTVKSAGFPHAKISEAGRLPKGLTFKAERGGRAVIEGKAAHGTRGRYVITLIAGNGVGPAAQQVFVLRVR